MSLESRRNLAAELRDRVQFLSNPDVSWALSSSVDDLPVTRPVGRNRVFRRGRFDARSCTFTFIAIKQIFE